MTATAPARPELTIHAERCAHQRVAAAHCDACVRSCPRNAWQLLDDGLAFDTDRCDACGLCVAGHIAQRLIDNGQQVPQMHRRQGWLIRQIQLDLQVAQGT